MAWMDVEKIVIKYSKKQLEIDGHFKGKEGTCCNVSFMESMRVNLGKTLSNGGYSVSTCHL